MDEFSTARIIGASILVFKHYLIILKKGNFSNNLLKLYLECMDILHLKLLIGLLKMSHVTHGGGVNILSKFQLLSFYGLGYTVSGRF